MAGFWGILRMFFMNCFSSCYESIEFVNHLLQWRRTTSFGFFL